MKSIVAILLLGATAAHGAIQYIEKGVDNLSTWADKINNNATNQANVVKGIWLKPAAGGTAVYYGSNGDAFTNAYDSASAGDTVLVGQGEYSWSTASSYWLWDKSVNVVGAGSALTTLRFPGTRFSESGTNCTLEGFTISQNNSSDTRDALNFLVMSTNDMYVTLRDITVETLNLTTTANHALQVTGGHVVLDHVNAIHRNNTSNKGHTFVLKGAHDVTITDCTSKGGGFDGFLFKSTDANLDTYNIVVNGFTVLPPDNDEASGLATAMLLQASNGYALSNVVINGYSCQVESLAIHITTPDAQNCVLSDIFVNDSYLLGGGPLLYVGNSGQDKTGRVDVHFSGLRGKSSAEMIHMKGGGTNWTVNVDGLRGTFGDGNRKFIYYNTLGDCEADLILSDVSVRRDDGYTSSFAGPHYVTRNELDVDGNIQFDQPMEYSISTDLENIAVGIKAANIGASANAAGTVTIVVTNTVSVYDTVLSVGDPVWCKNGSASGVYRIASVGTCPADDNPITGATSNDVYFTVSTTDTIEDGDFLFGKMAGRINIQSGQFGFNQVESTVMSTHINGSGTTVYSPKTTYHQVFDCFPAGTFGSATETEVFNYNPSVRLLPHVFGYDDGGGTVPYIAVFAEPHATLTSANYRGRHKRVFLGVKLWGDGIQDVGYKNLDELP